VAWGMRRIRMSIPLISTPKVPPPLPEAPLMRLNLDMIFNQLPLEMTGTLGFILAE
jgi:hypothetical protein